LVFFYDDIVYCIVMSLQDLFYLMAIITMGIHIVILIVLVIVLQSIRKKISETADAVERRMENVKDFVTHPNVVANKIGKVLLGQALTQITKIFRR
jgi:hypothetical protein